MAINYPLTKNKLTAERDYWRREQYDDASSKQIHRHRLAESSYVHNEVSPKAGRLSDALKVFAVTTFALLTQSSVTWGQVANLPAKQTIQVSFDTNSHKVIVATNDIIPFVPIEFSGNWPDSVTKLTFRLLHTSTEIPYKRVEGDLSRLRSFHYGDGTSATQAQMLRLTTDTDALDAAEKAVDNAKIAADAAQKVAGDGEDAAKQRNKVQAQQVLESAQRRLEQLRAEENKNSIKFEEYQADIQLDRFFDFEEKIKDELKGAGQSFTVTIDAPQLRRYYGVQILAEGPKEWKSGENRKDIRVLHFATEGVINSGKADSRLDGGSLPVIYAGDLDALPHERFIPFSGVGVGFLDIDEHPAYPFLLTSVGLIVSVRPIYNGVKNPFIHRYAQGWRRPTNWILNRSFFSGGITTASLTYRGRALATSTVKGTVGAGLFLLPGLGVSFDCSFGGVANYNSAFDNRSKPFFMLGASLRFTGQVTQLFKSNIGASIDPQFSK